MLATRLAVAIAGVFAVVSFSTPLSSAGAPAADKEMKQVLGALDALGPKPFETLSPDEARKQPTPADAVKSVL